MAKLPVNFRQGSEGNLINYTLTNMIEGTGSIVYYCGEALDDNAAAVSTLDPNLYYSDDIEAETTAGTLNQTYALELSKNYDTTAFDIPQVVKGTGLVSISFGVYGHASATIYGYVKAVLQRMRGAVSTTIGTGQSAVITNDGGASWDLKATALSLDLTATSLKIGDSLRLTIYGYMKNSTGSFGGKIAWGQDPRNRDGSVLTAAGNMRTDTQIKVPFKIQQ